MISLNKSEENKRIEYKDASIFSSKLEGSLKLVYPVIFQYILIWKSNRFKLAYFSIKYLFFGVRCYAKIMYI